MLNEKLKRLEISLMKRKLGTGELIDLSKAKLVTLSKSGKADIYRVQT